MEYPGGEIQISIKREFCIFREHYLSFHEAKEVICMSTMHTGIVQDTVSKNLSSFWSSTFFIGRDLS